MTYRNKLLIRRILIVLAVLLVVVLIAALVSFVYLGRYVVYTENGAYFSFLPQSGREDAVSHPPTEALQSVLVVTGSAVSAEDLLNEDTGLPANEIRGVLVDYDTLAAGVSLGAVTVGGEYNTLLLEVRKSNSSLLTTATVTNLIQQAKNQEMHLIALFSCLPDTEYALAHMDEAFQVKGGFLWPNGEGSYVLDPTQAGVIDHLAQQITQLSEMGFDEVVLNDFSIPYSDSIVYSFDRSREELMKRAYHNLVDATLDSCDLGLLVSNPDEGHQLMDAVDHIYVRFSEGSQVERYAAAHPDHYLVFITDSHDTRFDGFGRVTPVEALDLAPAAQEEPVEMPEETPEEDTEIPEE